MKISTWILAIVVTASLLSTIGLSFGQTNSIPSPREQMDSGINPANVVCKEGLKLVIRANSNTAACITKESYEKIIQIGWAKTLLDFKENPQMTSIGEVRTIRTVPLYLDPGVQDSNPEIVTSYNYVFEACAKSSAIKSPEILIISDSETRRVALSSSIPAMSCQTSTAVVKATDPASIKSSLVKKTDLALIVADLESKVAEIKARLATEKADLGRLVKQDPIPSDFTKLVSDKTAKITSLRSELDLARADLQKNQYVLIVGTSEPAPVQLKLQNKEIPASEPSPKNYAHVNVIKTVPQFVDAGILKSDPVTSSSYNFVFEACAGENNIMYPQVMIRSDSEVKSLKLSESLDPYSCEISSTIIKAGDQNSIYGAMITTGDISQMLQELEAKVSSLQENISNDKKTLGILVNQKPPPDDFSQRVSELTQKIVNQRNELNKTKQELVSIKYMVNE